MIQRVANEPGFPEEMISTMCQPKTGSCSGSLAVLRISDYLFNCPFYNFIRLFLVNSCFGVFVHVNLSFLNNFPDHIAW